MTVTVDINGDYAGGFPEPARAGPVNTHHALKANDGVMTPSGKTLRFGLESTFSGLTPFSSCPVQVTGIGDTGGIALVEVYEVP